MIAPVSISKNHKQKLYPTYKILNIHIEYPQIHKRKNQNKTSKTQALTHKTDKTNWHESEKTKTTIQNPSLIATAIKFP
jgi:hypothetical protein